MEWIMFKSGERTLSIENVNDVMLRIREIIIGGGNRCVTVSVAEVEAALKVFHADKL